MTAPHRTHDTYAQPLPDTRLSPFTGYTRAHWESHADRLLAGLLPYATPDFAQFRLPGRTGHAGAWSDGLEGYARSFLLAAFRTAGAQGRDAPGSTAVTDLITRYATGLAAGTDPRHPERWPQITDRSQPMVEAASIAVALHETRPWLWDHLPDAVRQRVAAWLEGFVGARPNDSNWRLFQVITEEFLASIGASYRQSEIDSGLARLDDWYRGDGWYTDGDGRKFDYYNALALHLYPALWSRIAGDRADAALVATHRSRMRSFLDTHQHFFGSDGAPVHQGRSLTYRFATAAPLFAGALVDASPLPPGRTRRLASGALRHFADRGAPDGDGLLSLGWYRPFLPVTQPYSGPASPYWASKAFLGLLLPAEHPVWTETEEAAPVDVSDRHLALPAPGWLLHSTTGDGIVRLVNHGSDRLPPSPAAAHHSPHYSRFAYSSVTAPETPPQGEPDGPDNHIALVGPEGPPTLRSRIHPLHTGDRHASSWHTPSAGGGEGGYGPGIVSTSVVHGPWEMRVHRVRAAAGLCVREGGWAVACDDAPPVGETGPGWAVARRADGLTTVLVGVLGWDEDGLLPDGEVEQASDRNAVGYFSATPLLRLPHHPGGTRLLATLVVLTSDPQVHKDVPGLRRLARVSPTAHGMIEVRFPDGTSICVQGGPPTAHPDLDLDLADGSPPGASRG
ncbi:DUF2264 domain-containing protein [Streptomyces sp. NPDC060209]|uniref:DUF2264 domain-containing protein n=1 Tax=Streptomyces sp. NPDC060209 TaxID=3347073 RepID=UPI00364D334B